MAYPIPPIVLTVLEDLSPAQENGFLRLQRQRYRAEYQDGSTSTPFVYDQVGRAALDAVVLVAHYSDAQGARWVYLRSALRPPLLSRLGLELAEPEPHARGQLWELPAGLIEREESTPEGVYRCAQRELLEELGFRVELDSFLRLGHSALPCPGVIAERQFYFEVEVDPKRRETPTLDGSALERGGVVMALRLLDALELCRNGQLDDAKTELGLRRLAEKFV